MNAQTCLDDGCTYTADFGYTRGGCAVPGNMARRLLALRAALALPCLPALSFDTAGQWQCRTKLP